MTTARPGSDRSPELLRAMLSAAAGFCILTVGGMSVLLLPGQVNIWLTFLVLAVSSALLALAARDLQTVMGD